MAEDRIFHVVYPVKSLDGGLNNKYDPSIIADNEAQDCKNVVFDELGGVATRLGSKKLNTASVGSFAGEGLFTARFENGTEQMLGWWNGSMFKLVGTTFVTVPSAQSVFTAGTRVDAGMYQDIMFFGNGGSKPYKYNGTEFTRQGVPAPNSAPVATSGTAGASGPPGGVVQYQVAYVNSYAVIGDLGPTATVTLGGTTATVSLASIPLAPVSFGVVARNIYRVNPGTGGLNLLTTINDNTTTTYVDQAVSGSLGSDLSLDIFNPEPPNWKFIKVHKDRLFLVENTNPSFLWYTDIGEPFSVDSLGFIKFGDGDGETCRGISVHSDSIIFFKDSCAWALYMSGDDSGNDWFRIKTNSKYGAASHFAVVDYNQNQMFLGKRLGNITGFYSLTGISLAPDQTTLSITNVTSESQSDRIEPDVLQFLKSISNNAAAIEYKNKLWFTVPSVGTSTSNDKVYQFDFQRRDKDDRTGSWVPFTFPVNFLCFTEYNGLLYAQAQTANGFVYQLENSAYTDDGTTIDSTWQGKDYSGFEEHIENQKDFRWANFTAQTFGAFFMNLRFTTDSDASLGTTVQVDLNPGGSLWGSMIWSVSNWGGATNRKKFSIPLGPARGKKVSFRFDNQNVANSAFHVLSDMTFTYNKKGKRYGRS